MSYLVYTCTYFHSSTGFFGCGAVISLSKTAPKNRSAHDRSILGIIPERKLVSMQNFIRLFCAQLGMKRHRLIAEQICFYGHFSEVLRLSFEGLIFWICLYGTKRRFNNKCFISISAISFTSTLLKLFRSGNSSRE